MIKHNFSTTLIVAMLLAVIVPSVLLLSSCGDNANKWIEVQEVEYDDSGNLEVSTDFEYDEDGKKVKEYYKDLDESDNVSVSADYALLENDENGNVIKRTEYSWDGIRGDWYDYEYNGDLLIKEVDHAQTVGGNEDITTEYEYDKYGNVVKEITSWEDDGYVSQINYENTLDENNKVIETVSHYEEDGEFCYLIKYKYDENGNLMNEEYYDESGSINFSRTHEWIQLGDWEQYNKEVRNKSEE